MSSAGSPGLGEGAAALVRLRDQLRFAFAGAVARSGPPVEHRLRLAGHVIQLRFATAALAATVIPALAHLEAAGPGNEPVDLEVLAWDQAGTGVPAPERPWAAAGLAPGARLALAGVGERFRVAGATGGETLQLWDREVRQAVWCTPSAAALPTFHHAAPFLQLFQWWGQDRGLRIVHAGCVGTERGAVLLAGRGGSGKSTTALLSVLHGMDYLSDDFTLVGGGDAPRAYCLYSTGKLHRDHLGRFPELASRAVDPVPDVYEKPVIFLHRHFPGQVIRERAIRAVVAPRVAGVPETGWSRLASGEALRALAPSTVAQLSPDDPTALPQLARLVRAVPSFRLDLGTRTEAIPPALRALLEEVG